MWRKPTLVVFGLVLGILIAEFIVRSAGYSPFFIKPINIVFEPSGIGEVDDILGYVAKPGEFSSVLAGQLSSNATHWPDHSRATRESEMDSSISKNPRIHLYGCSFTYGQYLDDTMCLGWKLQQFLPNYDVRNYAFGGYGVVQAYLQLKQHLHEGLLPKSVVLGYASFQDERNVMPRSRLKLLSSYENQKETMDQVMWPIVSLESDTSISINYKPFSYQVWPLTKHSALINLVESIRNQSSRNLDSERLTSKVLVDSMFAWSQEFGFDLIVMGVNKDQATADFLQQCERKGMHVLDASVELTSEEFSLYPLDGHPNTNAHSFFARRLADYME